MHILVKSNNLLHSLNFTAFQLSPRIPISNSYIRIYAKYSHEKQQILHGPNKKSGINAKNRERYRALTRRKRKKV